LGVFPTILLVEQIALDNDKLPNVVTFHLLCGLDLDALPDPRCLYVVLGLLHPDFVRQTRVVLNLFGVWGLGFRV